MATEMRGTWVGELNAWAIKHTNGPGWVAWVSRSRDGQVKRVGCGPLQVVVQRGNARNVWADTKEKAEALAIEISTESNVYQAQQVKKANKAIWKRVAT